MPKTTGQHIPAPFADVYDYTMGLPRGTGFPDVYMHGAYYAQHNIGRRISRDLPRQQGLDNPFVPPDANAHRHAFAAAAAIAAEQGDTSVFPTDYIGPRPRWWWAEYSGYADPKWSANVTKQVLDNYSDLAILSWRESPPVPQYRFSQSGFPDTNSPNWFVTQPCRQYLHDPATVFHEIQGYLKHDARTFLELTPLDFTVTNGTAVGVMEIRGIPGDPDITTFTINTPPTGTTLLASFDVNSQADRQLIDPQGFIAFWFLLNIASVVEDDSNGVSVTSRSKQDQSVMAPY